MTKAYIKGFDEMAVHDGPGTRALVFVMGCNLRCKWCQNPELLYPNPQVWFCSPNRCKRCGHCVEVCPVKAIDLNHIPRIDIDKCEGVECGKCVEACPEGAYDVVGYEITPEELTKKLIRYKHFYDSSGGGITITGGDPLFVPEFSAELLELCQKEGVHTCIETALFANYKVVLNVVKHCNLILADLKHMDPDKHKEGTGASNKIILENFKKLNKDYNGEIYARIPLIPGFNDDEDNVAETARFLEPLEKVKGLDLLPFNVLPASKYEAVGMSWEYTNAKRQSNEHLSKLKKIVDSYNKRFVCRIGGMW